MAKNILYIFLDKLLAFPLWVKQIVYLRLYKNMSDSLSEDFITTREENVFHLYVPLLSFLGRTELSEKKGGYDDNIYNFLTNVADGLNILEISMNNFWTMEEVAKFFIFCLDQNYIKTPESDVVHAMAAFIAGKIRTGEFFKKVGKINIQQLEQTITKQKENKEKGVELRMAETMISLGFITEKDTSSLMIIKEESKNRFILDSDIIPKQATDLPKDLKFYKDEVARLTEQNQILKEKLNKILVFLKKK